MIIALFLIGFIALATAVGVFFATKSPIGYEDEDGFHYGWQDGRFHKNAPVHAKIATFPIILRLPWAKPAFGLAALFIILLVVYPRPSEKNNNPTITDGSLKQAKLENPPDFPENPKINVTQSESSKFFQTLCQRSSWIE